jgi:hypothetical protein
MSVAFTDAATGNALQRGWVNMLPQNSPRTDVAFVDEASKVKITAYPNLTQWDKITTSRVWLDIDLAADKDTTVSFKPAQPVSLEAGQVGRLEFTGAASGYGTLELFDATGASLEKIAVRLP